MEENRSAIGLAEPETILPSQEPIVEIPTPPAKKDGPRHAAPRKKKAWWVKALAGTGIGLSALIVLVVIAFLVIFYSPWFLGLRDQYILMTYNTSNPWLCTTFFSEELIQEVFAQNSMVSPDGSVNPDLVNPTPTPDPEQPEDPTPPKTFAPISETFGGEVIYDDGQVQIIQFSGKTVKGKYTARLIQILDPSRLTLGITSNVGSLANGVPGRGQLIVDMCNDNDALCGINAGGFVDNGGVGSGGIPLGTVVKDGVMTVHSKDVTNGKEREHILIGFNEDNVLVMGNFTEDEVKEHRIRDAMSWREPAALILNGEKAAFTGLAGGYDPRSAIGQRADGTVLLLAVDGSELRSVDGANYALLADIMEAYGAVNAANLDGGTSTVMALNGEVISNNRANPAIAYRGRYLATSWLVKNVDTPTTDTTTTTTAAATTTTVSQ